jgi:hypothetical protein
MTSTEQAAWRATAPETLPIFGSDCKRRDFTLIPQGMVVRAPNVFDVDLATKETLNRAHQLVNQTSQSLRQ